MLFDKAMEHLQGIIPVQEDWHAGIFFMKVIILLLLQHIYVELVCINFLY